MTVYYPIQRLTDGRLAQLERSHGWLVPRLGYVNISKGIRRLNRLFSGDLSAKTSKDIISQLPEALIIDQSEVYLAVNETQACLDSERAAREAEWRAKFVPDAFLKGTSNIPSHIMGFVLSGGVNRHLKIPLDLERDPLTFLEQCLAFARNRPRVPFFGDTTGFIINYTPDHVESYDLKGNLIKKLDFYYRPGEARVYF